MSEAASGPMMEQYRRIKRENAGSVLFFRLGDFYEMFAEDALEVSALLNLTLTNRSGLPMCGVPYHAARSYIGRLLKLGKKVAICEQVSQSAVKGRKVMERQVVEVITPGTTVDEDYLERGQANYLAAIAAPGSTCALAYIDLSTGSFYATSFAAGSDRLAQELERLQVREMIVQESLLEESSGVRSALLDRPGLVLNRWADWLFDRETSKTRLERQFGVSGLKGFGIDEASPHSGCIIAAAGALLSYLDSTAKSLIPHVRGIGVYGDSEFVGIDESSQRNLELVRNMRDGSVKFTLLEVMDETRCAMGKRLLRQRLLRPLRNLAGISARLDTVQILFRDQGNLGKLGELLGKTPDLERLSSRLAMDKAHGKDMLSIKNALVYCAAIKEVRDSLGIKCECDAAVKDPGEINGAFARLMLLRELLEKGICDEPSILLTEGNLIREGYSQELDGLRRLKDSGRQLLENYLEEEKRATGISGLKIRYNRLIGYFFEVTKAQLSRVPGYFIRRQGIVGGERFSTQRLAALESDINGAEDKIAALEKSLFLEIREKAKLHLAEISAEACRIAELDVAQSLARAACLHGWVRPDLDDSGTMEVTAARHPVVQAHLAGGEFIPNDIFLKSAGEKQAGTNTGVVSGEGANPSFALITGPNMAGKSTYLRSAALIAVMAQMGSFIPANGGRIGLCDRIYCRVGASDNLARGESTFLVEMNETACILNTAGERSLVIMDEVGRGTGTNDGLSIAWAVSEELLNKIGCRTLFATHYHELSLLSHPALVNRSMEVVERDGKVVFLRRLREGPASESYGLHVASLAGLSSGVLERAGQIMQRLRERDAGLAERLPEGGSPKGVSPSGDLPVTTENRAKKLSAPAPTHEEAAFLEELRSLDPDTLTPIQALAILAGWKKRTGGSREAKTAAANARHAGRHDDIAPSLFD